MPRRRAFALIDVIIATILLGVSLAVLIGLSGRAISAQTLGADLQTAAMLADEQLNLILARGPDDYASRFPLEGPCDPPFEAFRYRLDLAGGTASSPYRVAATISWNAGLTPQTVIIETLIAPRTGDDPDPLRTPESVVERQP